MGFSRLTSGERKRLQQGILTPQQATLISARAEAKNPQGFWSTTWGQVIRGVGIAALNFIPGVGGVASQAVGAYDQARATSMQRAATSKYSALLAGQPRPTAPGAPYLSTSPYPWLPDYGTIGGVPGYAGGVINPGSGGAVSEDYGLGEIQATLASQPAWIWWALAGGLLLLIILGRR